MPKIIAICGPIASGKTTVADILSANDAMAAHFETSTVVIELANILNKAIAATSKSMFTAADIASIADSMLPFIVEITRQQFASGALYFDAALMQSQPSWFDKLFVYLDLLHADPQLAKQLIDSTNKAQYRSLLQWLGGYVPYRLNEPLLWYKALQRKIEQLPALITLVALTAPRHPAEAEFVQQVMHGQVLLVQRPGITTDTTELTEKRVLEIVPNAVLYNNGSIADLKSCVERLKVDLLQDKLLPSYSAI